MRSRIDQYGSIVDDRVAVLGRTVLAGNLVIGDARVRKLGADAHVALVAIGRMPPFHDVAVKARPRVVGDANPRGAGSRADRGPDRTADGATDNGAPDSATRDSAPEPSPRSTSKAPTRRARP